MILADTSVWIAHLNHVDATMSELLAGGKVLVHPFVMGEIGLGSMPNWDGVMFRLGLLPPAPEASDQAIIELIGGNRLQGSGIGYVDAHLLASCLLSEDIYLWTRDRRLNVVAARLGIDAAIE